MSNENNIQSINAKRLTIRISRFHLSFSTSKITTEDNPISYEQYAMRSGISTAANLREALKTALLPQDAQHLPAHLFQALQHLLSLPPEALLHQRW